MAPTGRRTRLPRLSATPYQEGRTIVRTVSAAAPTVPALPPRTGEMYPAPSIPEHRWAMAIDLDRCTGCQACVVACYAENNIPVVGPEVDRRRGRNMAWLRIERYFESDRGRPAKLRVDLLLMLCQQCDNAPCEPVCPVYATYHTPEGLNAQVYNRCVGTRYCSNNCPYKVRTLQLAATRIFAGPLNLQLNPDVTRPLQGRHGEVHVLRAAHPVRRRSRRERGRARCGTATSSPACAQTCPAQASSSATPTDPDSRCRGSPRDGRGYRVLEELNTAPGHHLSGAASGRRAVSATRASSGSRPRVARDAAAARAPGTSLLILLAAATAVVRGVVLVGQIRHGHGGYRA